MQGAIILNFPKRTPKAALGRLYFFQAGMRGRSILFQDWTAKTSFIVSVAALNGDYESARIRTLKYENMKPVNMNEIKHAQ